jgi:hypothetical protein
MKLGGQDDYQRVITDFVKRSLPAIRNAPRESTPEVVDPNPGCVGVSLYDKAVFMDTGVSKASHAVRCEAPPRFRP